jgi:peptidyl-tRNA hydrolase, PTH1 family
LRCVVGLGNPGKKYAMTRHNIGFIVLDKLAEKNKLNFLPSKKDFYYSEGTIVSSEFFLLKPTTYMNLSGAALLDYLNQYPTSLEDILIVYDDVNLPVGKIRLRKSGSDGGHNGIKSIIYHLQDDNFPRLRFGIGSDFSKGEMADYVLSKFNSEDYKAVEQEIDFAVTLIEEFIKGGYKTMADCFARASHPPKQKEENPSRDEKTFKNQ